MISSYQKVEFVDKKMNISRQLSSRIYQNQIKMEYLHFERKQYSKFHSYSKLLCNLLFIAFKIRYYKI